MGFPNEVLDFCRRQDLLHRGDRVICALSGGADSVALLWCMYLLKDTMDLTLEAAHFNHGLRGAESDRDEAFVRDLCARYDIPLTVGRGTVTAEGRGLEDAARRARYDFFGQLPPDALVATAHTADDNAETFLLRLLRGAGLRGLGAIAPKRGRIIRPMLSVTRAQVEAFLSEWGLSHVEDSSNGTDAFLRNRLRRGIMPTLREENPRFSRNVSRMALSLRQDADFLDREAEKALEAALSPNGLSCGAVLSLHPAIGSRVLAMYLQSCGLREPETVHLDALRELLRSDRPSAGASFPGGLILQRKYDRLAPLEKGEPISETPLEGFGEIQFPGWVIQVERGAFPADIQKMPDTFYAPLAGTLTVRCRRTGDRMLRPGGHKSLKKLMIDAHIPAALRDCLPVVLLDDEIVFVPVIGVSARCRMEPGEPARKIVVQRKR